MSLDPRSLRPSQAFAALAAVLETLDDAALRQVGNAEFTLGTLGDAGREALVRLTASLSLVPQPALSADRIARAEARAILAARVASKSA